MKYSLPANPAEARQTKERFAKPEEQLSYEVGKAVQELPPLYTRLLAGTISLVVLGSITWAHFSQVDEVATAPGEIIPATQVRAITSLGNGSIIEVKVKEGDRITKDQVLIQRDSELKQTDVSRLTEATKLIEDDIHRLQAERIGTTKTGIQLQDELLASRLTDYQARQAVTETEAQRQLAIIAQAQERQQRLQANLANAEKGVINAQTNVINAENIAQQFSDNLTIAQKRLENLEKLLNSGGVPRLDYLEAQERFNRANMEITRARDEVINSHNRLTEAQNQVTSLKKDIAAQAQEIRQAEQAYQGVRQKAQSLASERQSEILSQINQRKQELTNIKGQLTQAIKEQAGETIKAPVTGTVYQVKATKGPVQTGEELLSILPDGQEMLLEVKVLNRDIGFIREGMRAKVKMATFPFQEFGTIDGEVVHISPNALVDKELGLVFPTRIQLTKHSMNVRGVEVPFTPGMAANGEIVTRKKSILTFILEPVTQRFREAFSVR